MNRRGLLKALGVGVAGLCGLRAVSASSECPAGRSAAVGKPRKPGGWSSHPMTPDMERIRKAIDEVQFVAPTAPVRFACSPEVARKIATEAGCSDAEADAFVLAHTTEGWVTL